MRITAPLPLLQAEALTALTRTASTFPDVAKELAAPAAAPSVPLAPSQQPATSVQMLVAMAAAEPVIDRRRRLAASAERALTLLDRLEIDMVSGAPVAETLQNLTDWSAAFDLPSDPELAALAQEIEVRVRVEIAKYDRTV